RHRVRLQVERRQPHGRGRQGALGRPQVAYAGPRRPHARRRGVAREDLEVAGQVSLFVRTITRKRDGGELTPEQISDFVEGVTSGTIPDEQAASLLMAICCRGMTTAETSVLTFTMMKSGEVWDLKPHGFVADKHSTGGVGDKATLVLAPLLAAVGVKAGMMS